MDASRCYRCGAALLRDAAACAACGTPVPAAETLTQQYREGQRLMQSPVLRAVYLLPLVIPTSIVGILVISKLVPKQYEGVVGDVLGVRC